MEPKVSLLCSQVPDAMNIWNVKSIQYSTKEKHFIQGKSLSFFFSLDISKVLELLKMDIGIFSNLFLMWYRKWMKIEIWMSVDINIDTCKRINVKGWH